MPIPKPQEGQSKPAFIAECLTAVADEYQGEQAVAICMAAWEVYEEGTEMDESEESGEYNENQD